MMLVVGGGVQRSGQLGVPFRIFGRPIFQISPPSQTCLNPVGGGVNLVEGAARVLQPFFCDRLTVSPELV